MNRTPIPHSPAAHPVREVLHGIEVEDPFRWLEDQDSSLTRTFVKDEQKKYRAYLNHFEELRYRIERRVTRLLTVEGVDLPHPDHRGGLVYLKRKAHDEQKAIYYRDQKDKENLLISVEMLGRDSYASLAIMQVSPDGRYVVFGIRTGGEDAQQIGIYDLTERQLRPDKLAPGYYRGLVFDKNQRGFFYVLEETQGEYCRRRAVRRHDFGTDQSRDLEIFDAGEGPGIRLVLQSAEDASGLGYLIFSLESVAKTRFLIHDLPINQPPRQVLALTGVRFGVRFLADTLEVSTTYEAPLGRIVSISLNHPEPQNWRDSIPESGGRLDSWERWDQRKILHYSFGKRRQTRIFDEFGTLIRTIEYPESGTSALGEIDCWGHRLFYAHSDITEPPAIYAVDLLSGEHRLWWKQENRVERKLIEVENRTYCSQDGTTIPITLIHPRGTKGVRPVLLSAYGGGGVSSTPRFSAIVTVLVEAGFTCAIAHVRGGGEGGLEWHIAAQKQRKQVSVDDFIYAARWLIESGYTLKRQLGIAGQSNGALITLCAVTERPDLFQAALALGPITDLTRFHLFGVARGFVEELGSPEEPEQFAALYRLSPYHRVRRDANYPAILIISGDRDKRCDGLHARKMIARLRWAAPQNSSILMDYTDRRGHKPVLPLRERIRALADRLTFLIAELKISFRESSQS